MNKGKTVSTVLTLHFAATVALAATASELPRTLRLDYYHTGSADEEILSLDRVVVEPLPWPGNPDRPLDKTELGKYFFDVRDTETGEALYSRGLSSIYGEWETTGEARRPDSRFHRVGTHLSNLSEFRGPPLPLQPQNLSNSSHR